MSNQKLVELLGISTKTLYKHFRSKEVLIEEVLNLFHSHHVKKWQDNSVKTNPVVGFLSLWHTAVDLEYNVNKAFFKDLNYYYPKLISRKEAALDKEFSKQIIQTLSNGIDEGFFIKTIHPELVFTGVVVLFRAIVREEKFKRFHVPAQEILSNTISPYIRGICTDKGLRELNKYINEQKSAKLEAGSKL